MEHRTTEDKTNTGTDDPNDGYVDTAYMGPQSHVMIKDADTDEVLINQRG